MKDKTYPIHQEDETFDFPPCDCNEPIYGKPKTKKEESKICNNL